MSGLDNIKRIIVVLSGKGGVGVYEDLTNKIIVYCLFLKENQQYPLKQLYHFMQVVIKLVYLMLIYVDHPFQECSE